MTDTATPGAPPPETDTWLAGLRDRETARQAKAAALWPGNKDTLFAALAAAGLSTVIVRFDGYGDSGQIEDIYARDPFGDVTMPTIEIEFVATN